MYTRSLHRKPSKFKFVNWFFVVLVLFIVVNFVIFASIMYKGEKTKDAQQPAAANTIIMKTNTIPPPTNNVVVPKKNKDAHNDDPFSEKYTPPSTTEQKPVVAFAVPTARKGLSDDNIIKVQLSDNKSNDKGCGHTLDRDYKKTPLRTAGLFSGEWPGCAVRCVDTRVFEQADLVRSAAGRGCAHTKEFKFTMENVAMSSMTGSHTLVGTTKLDSDVPVPYYSWAEYNYMSPVKEKTATAMMAVFISNCGARKRLDILSDLMKYGVTVHSYGRCMNNAALPHASGSYLDVKTDVTSKYKFTFAAENSETNDYVTEKLFGTLCSGSVPVYLGAPNAQKFAPAPKSIINVSDFKTTKELADFLLYLNSNDAAYNEYLEWKKIGPSADFIAVVDRAIVHSMCRACIKTADYQRAMYGNRVGHETKTPTSPEILPLQVRPRGEFYMKYVYLAPNEQNVATFFKKLVEMYHDHDPEVGAVHSVFRLWDRLERPITDEDFKQGLLADDDELEIIFTYPLHPERKSYYKWQLENKR